MAAPTIVKTAGGWDVIYAVATADAPSGTAREILGNVHSQNTGSISIENAAENPTEKKAAIDDAVTKKLAVPK